MSEDKKSTGVRYYQAGDILFHEKDVAKSLFIIQKGQVRLYKPKGKGFVDLAILRNGEVLGEMSYFDEKSKRRNCSAQSVGKSEIVEISFSAFDKAMSNLNPWFKTIITTFASRLNKANDKIKGLESNSVGFGKDGKASDYVFFHNSDILRSLSILYLGITVHGEEKEGGHEIHLDKLKFYLFEVFTLSEIKWEELLLLYSQEGFLQVLKDDKNLNKIIRINRPETLKTISIFLNAQRRVDEDKQIVISNRCQTLLQEILDQLILKEQEGDKEVVDLSLILEDLQLRNENISEGDLEDAVDAGICEDVLINDSGRLTTTINFTRLSRILPGIKMMNAVKRANEKKARDGKKSY